jgi:hypothetical protein
MIIGIDPGSTETAYCRIDNQYHILEAQKFPNEEVAKMLKRCTSNHHVAIESIQSYGMPVGREIFETCFWIGEYVRICKDMCLEYLLIPRPEYTRRICGVGKINDTVLRQALLLRFGGDKKEEPLNSLKGSTDKRSAFAVAVYLLDTLRWKIKYNKD